MLKGSKLLNVILCVNEYNEVVYSLLGYVSVVVDSYFGCNCCDLYLFYEIYLYLDIFTILVDIRLTNNRYLGFFRHRQGLLCYRL